MAELNLFSYNHFMNYYKKIPSKMGPLHIVASDKGISYLGFEKSEGPFVKTPSLFQENLISKVELQLGEYFDGKRKKFDILLDLEGTQFQKRVWSSLQKIPFGKTISYKQLALNIGNEKSSRAVGGANGKNPVCIIVPCHRVINANGTLGGYSGGLDKKVKLLAVEDIKI